nr:MAG TPA: conopeptide [Caudoviricetes sp.]
MKRIKCECNGDCFNCKYEDCIAPNSLINKFSREEKEKETKGNGAKLFDKYVSYADVMRNEFSLYTGYCPIDTE